MDILSNESKFYIHSSGKVNHQDNKRFKRGFERAAEMLEKGEEKGVFVWAPSLKRWLKDLDYVFWLGTVR